MDVIDRTLSVEQHQDDVLAVEELLEQFVQPVHFAT